MERMEWILHQLAGKMTPTLPIFIMNPTTTSTSDWLVQLSLSTGASKASEASARQQAPSFNAESGRVLNCHLRDLTVSTPEYTSNMFPVDGCVVVVVRWAAGRIKTNRNGAARGGSNQIRRVSDPTCCCIASHLTSACASETAL